jgi:putative phosphoesterase
MKGPGLRVGIVSDLHGNAEGLAAALERMGDVDELLCAGDIATEYRFSNESVKTLRAREARCVLGNHDLGLLGPHGDRARAAVGVDRDLVAELATYPLTYETTVSGKKLLMTHASPCAPYTQYVSKGSPELKRIAEVDADYVIIGHTHSQLVERVGKVLVINPGSVGQGTDHANNYQLSYAVLDTTTDEVVIDNFTLDTNAEGAP